MKSATVILFVASLIAVAQYASGNTLLNVLAQSIIIMITMIIMIIMTTITITMNIMIITMTTITIIITMNIMTIIMITMSITTIIMDIIITMATIIERMMFPMAFCICRFVSVSRQIVMIIIKSKCRKCYPCKCNE
ncbi:hypothetical protein CEXT_344611 [Caerostris extrusa]|uniref:Uncharacterized protein n=1 Tax=Caerostris extrusa TaxID=172846 RepID=A0AAV4P3X0_CAEEX|nr:hypothetical protein CEXT_344611 [Caerostris extrusa]